MEEQQLREVLYQIAEREVPSVDLWRLIKPEAVSVSHGSKRRLNRAPGFASNRLARGMLVGLILTAFLGLFTASHIAVGQVLQQLGIVTVSSTPKAPIAGGQNAPHVVGSGRLTQWESLSAVQQQIGFQVHLPAWLPSGVSIEGAALTADAGTLQGAIVRYGSATNAAMTMGVQETKGAVTGSYGVPAGASVQTSVGGQSAAYTHGVWTTAAGSAARWNPQADFSMVSWESDGIVYVLSAYDSGFSRDEMLRIAGSL